VPTVVGASRLRVNEIQKGKSEKTEQLVRIVGGDFKIKVLEDKVTAIRIRWYGHVLRKMPKRKIKLKTVTHMRKSCHTEGGKNMGI